MSLVDTLNRLLWIPDRMQGSPWVRDETQQVTGRLEVDLGEASWAKKGKDRNKRLILHMYKERAQSIASRALRCITWC